jgi:hypothetical protein
MPNGKFTIQASNVRPFRNQATLYGYVDLTIVELGLTFYGCLIHQTSLGNRRIDFPGMPLLTPEGETRKKDNGKPMYIATAAWGRQEVRDAFVDRAIEAVLKLNPDIFGGK